jgi:predicted metal-dependent phosphoesterase TrpH
MSRIDLHTHTTASDGIMTPAELVDYAMENDVSVMAIADHDTVDALPEAMDYAEGKNIEIVPAIEFSIDWNRGTFHIVALHIDYHNEKLKGRLNWLSERRSTRALRIVEDLVNHGIDISMDEVLETAAGGVIGKPHVARVLVKHGYAENTRSVFYKIS